MITNSPDELQNYIAQNELKYNPKVEENTEQNNFDFYNQTAEKLKKNLLLIKNLILI